MGGFGGPGFQVMDVTRLGTTFFPVEGTSTLYTGQLVYSYHYGVEILAAAAGHGDITNFNIPIGVVVGNNNKTKLNGSSTYGGADYITGVNTAAAQILRDWRGAEGSEYPKNDPLPLVQVALIDCCSLIRGRIFNNAYGTAPTVGTVSAGATTAAFTTSAVDSAGITYQNMAYCRSGNNAGTYRILNSANTTTHTCVKEWPATPATGDKILCNLFRKGSNVHIQIDATSMYIDCSATSTTHYYSVDVVKINYEIAGEENMVFRFSPITFFPALT